VARTLTSANVVVVVLIITPQIDARDGFRGIRELRSGHPERDAGRSLFANGAVLCGHLFAFTCDDYGGFRSTQEDDIDIGDQHIGEGGAGRISSKATTTR
jgi:hypothetical protein